MRIPVFLSCPTALSDSQAESRKIILAQLAKAQLEPRALGRSDYPTELPLREVAVIARHCAGCVILGFSQIRIEKAISKEGTAQEIRVEAGTCIPTPWNHLEAGILFSVGVPLLVFRELGVSGGVFDNGVTDVFVHQMPPPAPSRAQRNELTAVFMKWQSEVRRSYYE